MPLLRAQYPATGLVFIDDGQAPGQMNGHDIVTWSDFLERQADEKAVSIAISASHIRQTLAEKCAAANLPLIEARAASVVQMDEVVIGDGACLSPFVTLTSNIRIGRCLIGDYVTFAPGAKVNGNVTIGDHAYIGSGAIIRQGITIGAGAIVGMGAVVTHDVPLGVTVVGNPAKPLIKD
jgi:acetyltransferase-like isoleucine patch superfamily enzyme